MTDLATPAVPQEEPRRGAAALAALFAAGVALALYAPRVWGHGFVNYDDPYLTSAENPAIGQGLRGFLSLLDPSASPQFMNAWLPLYYGSLGLDHWLFGGAPPGWHLHSVALHAACAGMVAVLARRLGLGAFGAAVAGIAFAVHPAATENVAWIASRKDVLSFLWMTVAAWCYLRAVEERRPWLHVAGAVCLAVSLTAKGTTLVLPLLLGVHASLLRRDGAGRGDRLRAVAPYAVVAAAMTALHLWVASREGTASSGGDAGFASVLAADLVVAWRYAVLLVLPLRQSVEWGIDAANVDVASAVLGAVVVAAAAACVAATRRSRPAAAAAVAAIALALAPFNNVFPRTSVLFAERYAHVALLPLALAVGAAARPQAWARWGARALIAVWAVLAALRLPVWSDAQALWTDAAEKAPHSALVQMQLADACAAAARAEPVAADAWNARAESAWRDAMRLATSDLDRMRAEEGLGTQLFTTAPGGETTEERVREAIALLDAALSRIATVRAAGDRGARRASILANRAAAHEQLGDAEAALADWQEATKSDPRNASAWTGLARLYLVAGRGREASECLARSATLAPSDPALARQRSDLRLQAGDVAGAKAELEAALAKDPHHYDTLLAAAVLDARLSRPVDAEKRFRAALAARPDDDVARQGVAAALVEQAQAHCARDDLAAARAAAQAATEFAPASSAPEQMLGIIERRGADLDAATLHLRRAFALQPDGQRIREALASVLLERAVAAFDAGDDATGDALAEEASQVGAPAVATHAARLENGVSGWPPSLPGAGEKAVVTRRSALRALALLACGRASDALPELAVAERGSEGADPALRRNIVRLLVRARFLTGRADAAVAAAEELPRLAAPDDPWSGWADLASARVERGIARRSAGDGDGAASDFDEARALLDAAASHGMPRSRWNLRRGEIRFAEERFVEATREFDLASDAAPEDPDPLLDRAAVWRTHYLLEEDRSYLEGAERDLRAALAAAPGDPRAMAALGEVLVLATKPGEAYPWLQRALLADPSQSVARRLLAELAVRAGRTHLEKKEVGDARAVAERALSLGAPLPGPTLLLGDVFRAEGDWAKALENYRTAERAFPGHPEVQASLCRYHFDLGHLYLLKGRRRDAAEAFLAAQAIDTQGKVDVASAADRLHGIAVSAFQEGVRLRADGKLPEAAEAFTTSVLAEPTREGRFNLGLLRTEMGDLEGAAAAYGEALAAAPDDAPSRMNRAAVLLRLGRWDEAEADYRWFGENRPADDADRAGAERQLRWIADQRSQLGGTPRR